MIAALKQCLEALHIGLDCAMTYAAQVHQQYAGYKPNRHKSADEDVRTVEAAIAAAEAALSKVQEPVATKIIGLQFNAVEQEQAK